MVVNTIMAIWLASAAGCFLFLWVNTYLYKEYALPDKYVEGTYIEIKKLTRRMFFCFCWPGLNTLLLISLLIFFKEKIEYIKYT
jgi:hypothetical protein